MTTKYVSKRTASKSPKNAPSKNNTAPSNIEDLPTTNRPAKYSSFELYNIRNSNSADFGRSPVTFEKNEIKFDYNIFVTTWQDQIRMKQYSTCEKYCREVIRKLLHAEQEQAKKLREQQLLKQVELQKRLAQAPGAELEQKMNMNPVSPDALYPYKEYRSKVHFSLAYLIKKYFQKYDEAKKQYELSIETDRENPGAHFNLANMLVDHYKDFKTAEYHFSKAIQLEPTYALYRMTFAEFLWHDCDRHQESSNQYEELLKYTKDNEDIYFNYGLLLRDHIKNPYKARQHFQTAVRLAPHDTEAQQELQYTTQLLLEQKRRSESRENSNIKVAVQSTTPTSEEEDDFDQSISINPPLRDRTNNANANGKRAASMIVSSTASKYKAVYSSVSASNSSESEEEVNDNDLQNMSSSFMKSKQYHKRRSSARRSQAEMVLVPESPEEKPDKCDKCAVLIQQLRDERDEKQKIKMDMKQREIVIKLLIKKLDSVQVQLDRIQPYRPELHSYIANGAPVIKQNADQVLELLNAVNSMIKNMPKKNKIDKSKSPRQKQKPKPKGK